MSVDGRLSDLKATVQGWYDQVRERRPAILVLDGLDTVLSVENEVSTILQSESTNSIDEC